MARRPRKAGAPRAPAGAATRPWNGPPSTAPPATAAVPVRTVRRWIDIAGSLGGRWPDPTHRRATARGVVVGSATRPKRPADRCRLVPAAMARSGHRASSGRSAGKRVTETGEHGIRWRDEGHHPPRSSAAPTRSCSPTSTTPTPAPARCSCGSPPPGVNRADLLQRQGHYAPPPGESDVPGLEVSGVDRGPRRRGRRLGGRRRGVRPARRRRLRRAGAGARRAAAARAGRACRWSTRRRCPRSSARCGPTSSSSPTSSPARRCSCTAARPASARWRSSWPARSGRTSS